MHLPSPSSSALLLVDVQKDFLPTGSLPVSDAHSIIPPINALTQLPFHLICFTKDWHPSDHMSFSSNHKGTKPFETVTLRDPEPYEQTLWPDHCVQHTYGSQLADGMVVPENAHIIVKGTNKKYDSYSAFNDNRNKNHTSLSKLLRANCIVTVYICGLATDICVLYTVLDALKSGFQVIVIEDACRGLSQEGVKNAMFEMTQAGATAISSEQVV